MACSLLLSVFLVLSVCSGFGRALHCYSCTDPTENVCNSISCDPSENRCLTAMLGKLYHGCWESHKCNMAAISKTFGVHTLTFSCCSWDLCNNHSKAPGSPGSPGLSLSLGLALTLLHTGT